MEGKERILIIGAAGYFGRRLVKASLALGHPTFLLFRPQNVSDLHKCQLFTAFKIDGAILIPGSLDDYESLIAALKQVDVVLSTVGFSETLKQVKLVEAIKEVGTIKRFFPSEFGTDVDRVEQDFPYGNQMFLDKQVVRRATESANIPRTYISANCFAGIFVAGLAQILTFMPPRDHVKIYGQGDKKAIWVTEEDVAMYTMLSVGDPRTLNKVVYVRPPANILSQIELVSIWEKLIGKELQKTFISDEEWVSTMENAGIPEFEREVMGHFYHFFFRGVLYFELEGPHVEDTSKLFPDHKYVTVEEYLKRFV